LKIKILKESEEKLAIGKPLDFRKRKAFFPGMASVVKNPTYRQGQMMQ
jgi:hypothetical protein